MFGWTTDDPSSPSRLGEGPVPVVQSEENMRVKVCGIKLIERLLEGWADAVQIVLDGDMDIPWWLISIGSGVGSPWFSIQRLHLCNCRGILVLAADDIVPASGFQTEEGFREVERIYRMFGKRHSRSVVDFLRQIPPDGPDRLVVHCEGGISRSAAVARFAAEWRFGLDPDKDPGMSNTEGTELVPNPIIMNRLREEVGLPIIPFPKTKILEETLKVQNGQRQS